jgi:hypothetical protein
MRRIDGLNGALGMSSPLSALRRRSGQQAEPMSVTDFFAGLGGRFPSPLRSVPKAAAQPAEGAAPDEE